MAVEGAARYQRLTKSEEDHKTAWDTVFPTNEALIAAVCLSGPNTRPVKRVLFGLFEGAVSIRHCRSDQWRDMAHRGQPGPGSKVQVDWDAWCARSLADEDIVRFARSLGRIAFAGSLLDGTVIKTRLGRKATNISVLAAIGVRRDGQKVLLSIRSMGGESPSSISQRPTGASRPTASERSRPWRQFLDDLDKRGLKRPEFVIVDGAPGLEAALVALWGEDLPIQRCTVHSEGGNATGPNDRPNRNLLAHAPKHLPDELTEDHRDMIYADTAAGIETRRKAFLREWRLKCRAVADSLEEAGDRPFTFIRLDPWQWKSARTTNA
jgi:hypothetical protein